MPKPVERFYNIKYGDQLPVVKTVYISGHGRIRPFGIWLPARFIMLHNTGYDHLRSPLLPGWMLENHGPSLSWMNW
jgi:hypothetical protein